LNSYVSLRLQLKLVHANTGLRVDVTFNVSSSIRATHFIAAELAACPAIQPLFLLLKRWLQAKGLNDLYSGGVSSYYLALLVISFVQFTRKLYCDVLTKSACNLLSSLLHPLHKCVIIICKCCSRLGRVSARATIHALYHTYCISMLVSAAAARDADADLGSLVIQFLDHYGCWFRYERMGISVRDGGAYFSKAARSWADAAAPALLALEDPFLPLRDLGRKAYNIAAVTALWRRLYDELSPFNVPDDSAAVVSD
jgi:DNA polymerase sigma